jgi:rfaE bifunctional protein nucleotidyltransferase chain/domain
MLACARGSAILVLALAHAGRRDAGVGDAACQHTAAGIVVSKLGTATVELDELMLERSRDLSDSDWHRAKHYEAGEIETLVRRWRERGLVVGFTNGCFDIMHAGHIALLAAARAECDRLVVALNSDSSTRRLKGPQRPVNPLHDRSAVIAAVGSVDAVISFEDDTPIELIRRLKPDVLIKAATMRSPMWSAPRRSGPPAAGWFWSIWSMAARQPPRSPGCARRTSRPPPRPGKIRREHAIGARAMPVIWQSRQNPRTFPSVVGANSVGLRLIGCSNQILRESNGSCRSRQLAYLS